MTYTTPQIWFMSFPKWCLRKHFCVDFISLCGLWAQKPHEPVSVQAPFYLTVQDWYPLFYTDQPILKLILLLLQYLFTLWLTNLLWLIFFSSNHKCCWIQFLFFPLPLWVTAYSRSSGCRNPSSSQCCWQGPVAGISGNNVKAEQL